MTGAVLVLTVDAALLQRKESYFTGGFLSTDYLRGPGEVLLFVLVSLLADIAVVGVVAGAVMWAAAALKPRAAVAAGFFAGTLPLLAADVVTYELIGYLGDAVDVGLMFELTGGSAAEVFAVAANHLVTPFAVGAVSVAACSGAVWLVNRRDGGRPAGRPPVVALAAPLAVLGLAFATTGIAMSSSDPLQNGILRMPAGRALSLVLDEVTDVDGDGFGIASRLSDPDPTDARIFPFAVEVPGNGVDENGVGGDLPAGGVAYSEAIDTRPWVRRPDVVLVVLESFRHDAVGARVSGRPVTPTLDALAAQGVSSRLAYSHNGYTAQSRYHLLSGSLARIGDGRSLIDDFRANGYLTAYVSGQDESFGGTAYDIGFARADVAIDARSDRARRYSTFTTAGSLAVPFTVVEERVTEVLQHRVPDDRPLFLYVNFHDTHFPYSHDGVQPLTSADRLERDRIVPARRDSLWATYLNTAANVDRAVGAVLDRVRRARGVDPAVIVTADHGESLFDDGYLGHGHALNDVQTRVPFIVTRLPMIVTEPFGQVDLREALGAALRSPDGVAAMPQLRRVAGAEVFQYLGHVQRPRQIAFRAGSSRIVYDFRQRRVEFGDGRWYAPADLSPDRRSEFLRLVHYWERMMLARRSRLDG